MRSEARRGLARGALRLGLMVAFAGGLPAHAQPPSDAGDAARATRSAVPQGWAYAVANELMSPFCPGRTLAECPSPQAESLRMWIVVQEASGRPREAVLEELYARYGDEIRPRPRAEGFGLTAYVVPAAVFLGGGGLVAWFLRRWTRRREDEPATAPPALDPALDPEVDRWLERESPR